MDESLVRNGDGESCASVCLCVHEGNMRTRFYLQFILVLTSLTHTHTHIHIHTHTHSRARAFLSLYLSLTGMVTLKWTLRDGSQTVNVRRAISAGAAFPFSAVATTAVAVARFSA